jgi:hypothetical protein
MKLSKSDRNELLGYIQSNLMQRHYGLAELESRLKDDGYDYAAEDEDYGFDPYWSTQGCEA